MDKRLEERLKEIEGRLGELSAEAQGLRRDLHRPVQAVRDGYFEAALTNAGSILEAVLRDVWIREKISGKADAKTIEQLFSVVKEQAPMDRKVQDYVRDIQLARNRAAHGEEVEAEDCVECLRKLVSVLQWYAQHYASAPPAAQAGSQSASETAAGQAPIHRRWQPKRLALVTGAAILVVASAISGYLLFHLKRPKPSPPGASVAPSLVALPCKVLGSPESGYLTDAVPSTISTILCEVPGLETKVPPTSFEVEKIHGDLDKIAEAYGVQTFVLSTATAEGDHLVFNIQVVDARTRTIRWGHRYEGTRANYTGMAQEAAEGICRALLPQASPSVTSGGAAPASEAELAYQEGRFYMGRYGAHGERADFDRAAASYQRALTLDPKLAVAAAGMSHTYDIAIQWGTLSRTEGLPQAEAWARKALAIDPHCGYAWSQLSALEWAKPDPSMDRWLDGALKAAFYAPTEDNSLYIAIASGGSMVLAIECCRENVSREPLGSSKYMQQAEQLVDVGRAEEALPILDRSLWLSPDNIPSLTFKVFALAELGRVQEARALLEETERKAPQKPGYLPLMDFVVALAAGDQRSAQSSAREVIRICSYSGATWSDLQSWEACTLPLIASKAGKEDALELFQLCSRRGAYIGYDMLMLRPDLKELREDPRAAEGVRQTKAWFARTIKILQEARSRGECPKYLEKPMDDLLAQLAAAEKSRG